MISRHYSRKIKLWTNSISSDGYGGNTVTDSFLGSFWAEVKQNSSSKDNTLGSVELKDSCSFKIRSNVALNDQIKNNLKIEYRGVFYVASDIRYDDELFREVNIIANG